MIKISEQKLKNSIRRAYIRILSEAKALSEEEIEELGRKRPGRVAVGRGMEVLDPDIADVEQQLARAQWMSQSQEEPEMGPGMEDVGDELDKTRWLSKATGLQEDDLDNDSWKGNVRGQEPMELDPDDIQQVDPRDDTEIMSRTINIDPSERRPYAKKIGLPHDPSKLAESNLRKLISTMVEDILNR